MSCDTHIHFQQVVCFNYVTIFPLKRHIDNKGTQSFFRGTKLGTVRGEGTRRDEIYPRQPHPKTEKAIVLYYTALWLKYATRTLFVTQKVSAADCRLGFWNLSYYSIPACTYGIYS